MTEYKSDLLFGALTGNGRVLVVDDEPDIRKVVRMTLQKAGYEVIEAENGEKAIEAINTGENRLVLDTVICDIRMPKINGVQTIDYFQREYPHVPLIVLTAYANTEMAVSFLGNGVVDYLVKPVEAEKLKAAVAKAMEQTTDCLGVMRSRSAGQFADEFKAYPSLRRGLGTACEGRGG